MDLMLDQAQQDFVTGLLAAAAAFLGMVVVSWPYLLSDRFDARMRRVAGERERIRERGRTAGAPDDAVSAMRRQNGPWLARLVRSLGLDRGADEAGIAQTLQTAGFRSRSAVATYLGMRLISPLAAGGLAAFYLTVLMESEQPLSIVVAIASGAAAVGFLLPGLYLKNRIQKRQQDLQRAWPDALDLLLICVQSGMAIDPALQKVSEEIGSQSIDLAEELSLTTAELSFLPDRLQAYENLARRTGLECVRTAVASLKQAEKQGTSLARTLRVLAQENRDGRLMLAEKKAAALPPKLTVPMILFFLPVLFVVIITPAGIQIAGAT